LIYQQQPYRNSSLINAIKYPLSDSSAVTRVSFYYFLLFMSVGSSLPYLGLWLKTADITDYQVGLILASPSFAMVATTVFIGRLADRARDWRTAIIVCNWVIVLLIGLLTLVSGFVQILIVWTLWGLVSLAKFPILDAAAVRMARHRNIEFHKMRAYGSFGFVVGTLLAGYFFEKVGVERLTAVLLVLSVLRALMSHTLPYFRAGIEDSGKSIPQDDSSVLKPGMDQAAHRQIWFLLVLAGSALVNASHAYYYTFSAIIWSSAGYSKTIIALLWSVGVVCEIALMWKFATFQRKFSARILLIAAAVSGFVRWLCFGFEPGLPLLFMFQLLHGVTFALMFLATVNFIANWTPVENSAKAQALSATMNTFLMACTTVFSGLVFTTFQFQGYWIMGLLCLIAIMLVCLSWRLMPTDIQSSCKVQ